MRNVFISKMIYSLSQYESSICQSRVNFPLYFFINNLVFLPSSDHVYFNFSEGTHMLWFNFILGLNLISLCFKLLITIPQNKEK